MDSNQFAKNVADTRGWTLNTDEEFLLMLLEGLDANFERLGYLQCPCRLSWDDRKKDSDIVCPCVYAADDIAEYGHCYCSLFFAKWFSLLSCTTLVSVTPIY